MWKKEKQWQILFSWAPKSLWMVTAAIGKAVFSQVKQQGGNTALPINRKLD